VRIRFVHLINRAGPKTIALATKTRLLQLYGRTFVSHNKFLQQQLALPYKTETTKTTMAVADDFTKQFGSSFIPEDKDQPRVNTPWGKGTTIRTRRMTNKINNIDDADVGVESKTTTTTTTIYDVELDGWGGLPQRGKLSLPRMLHTAIKYPSVPPQVGDEVKTLWGRGRVVEIRHDQSGGDGMHVVGLSSWRLANRSSVKCYLPADQIEVMRPLRIYDMDVFQKVEHAMDLKQDASKKFTSKDYDGALELYAKAVDAVRYVQHGADSTNIVRADLLIVMITCSNNAGMCCLHLGDYRRAEKFAKNSLSLIEALYKKKDSSKILQVLHKDGVTDSQLFGSYRVKSNLIVAASMVRLHRPEEAVPVLKESQQIISTYKQDNDPFRKQLHIQEKEIRKLYDEATHLIKSDRQKEKKRARAMFAAAEEKKDTTDDSSRAATPQKSIETVPTPTNRSLDLTNVSQDMNGELDESGMTGGTSSQPPSPPPPKKRVSFADGTTPGSVDDDDEPGFFSEHKEALYLVAGIALGWLGVHLLTKKR
jgi:tetratricopeptide (TPR) repeat protein